MHNYKGKIRFILLVAIFIGGIGFFYLEGHPDAKAQEESTATPDAEGVIYSVVRPNDSLWNIAVTAGITLQELLDLNNLTQETIIQPGDLLIIGYGTPAPTATQELPTPTITSTRPPPTPTFTLVPPPRTAICLKAFNDEDKNGIHNDDESLKTAVAFTIFNEDVVVGNYITDGVSEPYCLDGLTPGDYKVTRSVGRDETLTTAGNWTLTLTRGSVLTLEFGSFTPAESIGSSDTMPTSTPEPDTPETIDVFEPESGIEENNHSVDIIIGFIILMVLLIGGGLYLAARNQKTS